MQVGEMIQETLMQDMFFFFLNETLSSPPKVLENTSQSISPTTQVFSVP